MSKQDKENRKQILKKFKEKQNNDLISSLPVTQKDARDLFDFLDKALTHSECDHTFKFVKEFLLSKNINHESVLPWLKENGAWCDCESLANVEEKYESLL